jgi:hypothetical protein
MINPNINRLNVTMTSADLTTIKNGFNSIGTTLDAYSYTLVPQERKDLIGTADRNMLFADDTLKQAQSLIAEFPPKVQNMVSNLKTDSDFLLQLDQIIDTLALPLIQRLNDTRRVVVHERYAQALAIYKIIKTNAQLGIVGFQAVYDLLKVYFPGGRKQAETEI